MLKAFSNNPKVNITIFCVLSRYFPKVQSILQERSATALRANHCSRSREEVSPPSSPPPRPSLGSPGKYIINIIIKTAEYISLAILIKLFSSQRFWTESPLRQLSLWLLPAVHQVAAWAEELSWRTKMEQHFIFSRQVLKRFRCNDVIATFRFV